MIVAMRKHAWEAIEARCERRNLRCNRRIIRAGRDRRETDLAKFFQLPFEEPAGVGNLVRDTSSVDSSGAVDVNPEQLGRG